MLALAKKFHMKKVTMVMKSLVNIIVTENFMRAESRTTTNGIKFDVITAIYNPASSRIIMVTYCLLVVIKFK